MGSLRLTHPTQIVTFSSLKNVAPIPCGRYGARDKPPEPRMLTRRMVSWRIIRSMAMPMTKTGIEVVEEYCVTIIKGVKDEDL